jgi:hypothetical protein
MEQENKKMKEENEFATSIQFRRLTNELTMWLGAIDPSPQFLPF